MLQIEGRHLTRRIWEFDPGAEEWEEKKRQELSLKASTPSNAPPSPDAEVYLAWLRTETSTVDLLKLTDAQSIPKPAEMDDLYARLMTGACEGLGWGGPAAASPTRRSSQASTSADHRRRGHRQEHVPPPRGLGHLPASQQSGAATQPPPFTLPHLRPHPRTRYAHQRDQRRTSPSV